MESKLNQMIELMERIVLLLEQQQATKNARKQKSRTQARELYTEEFGYFWDVYPKKNNKRSAAQAYHRAVEALEQTKEYQLAGSDTPHEFLVCRAMQYNAAWSTSRVSSEGDYRQHASTWLNQESYLYPESWGGFNENVQQRGPRWEPAQD